MIEIESKVIAFLRRNNLMLLGESIVVGVSGGADSVCLLHILAKWQREFDIKLYAAHLNHQLRGVESDEDAEYVANLAASVGVPLTVGKRNVADYRSRRNCPIEEAARELRYDFLAKVACDVGAHRVATGHTRDDQVETILMHILRGTGISGLCGLEPCSPFPFYHFELKAKNLGLVVIRPLLDITRQETLSYCQEHQLRPRFDSSNLSLSFLRNRLRLELLPSLRKYNPSVDQALLRLAKIAKDDSSFVEQQALQLWDEVSRQEKDAIYLDRKKIGSLPVALQSRLIRLAVDKVLGDTRDIEANHIEAISSLLIKPVGKKISLPHGIICQGEYDELIITSAAKHAQLLSSLCPFPPLPGEFRLYVPGETVLPGWKVIASIVQRQAASLSLPGTECRGNLVAEFDLDKTGTELFVRRRQPGDKFQPLGMDMPKKLQDFMVDAKIPLSWRQYIPLVCSPQQIVWVVGWRISDGVKVTEASKEVLRLEFIE
jgi:tRNA(Ile)-lysidine synthase